MDPTPTRDGIRRTKAGSVRTFSYRAGVRIRDSVLACDATGGSDLIFVSHAELIDSDGGDGAAGRRLPRARAGRRKILTTDATLGLSGAAGERLRPNALVAAYGRPFNLGGMRLELFPSGYGPGAASLLCEHEGRRLVYSGPVGAAAAEVRVADSLCLDGTFGASRFVFPPIEEALASVVTFATARIAAGQTPVVLAHTRGALMACADVLARAGVVLRAHRAVMAAAAGYHAAGLAVPVLARFAGRLAAGEALLWPAEARDAPALRRLTAAAFVLASGVASDPAAVEIARVDAAIPLSTRADFAGLLRYVEATGAREIAVLHARDAELCQTLRVRGIDAYPLGPPEQISLF
jgi:putative mRNA 3-end processing factor